MSLNIKFSYLAEKSKFSRSNSYFSILTPTFLRDGFLNSYIQNPSENSGLCSRNRQPKSWSMAVTRNKIIIVGGPSGSPVLHLFKLEYLSFGVRVPDGGPVLNNMQISLL